MPTLHRKHELVQIDLLLLIQPLNQPPSFLLEPDIIFDTI